MPRYVYNAGGMKITTRYPMGYRDVMAKRRAAARRRAAFVKWARDNNWTEQMITNALYNPRNKMKYWGPDL